MHNVKKINSIFIYLYPGKCGVGSSLFRFDCLKGANCIRLVDEFYESSQHFFFFWNKGQIQDDF